PSFKRTPIRNSAATPRLRKSHHRASDFLRHVALYGPRRAAMLSNWPIRSAQAHASTLTSLPPAAKRPVPPDSRDVRVKPSTLSESPTRGSNSISSTSSHLSQAASASHCSIFLPTSVSPFYQRRPRRVRSAL